LLPFSALASIHFVHRSAAGLVLAVLLWMGWRLRLQPGLAVAGRWLLGLCALQFATGLSNVVLGWPLLAAVMHTGGAAAMALTLAVVGGWQIAMLVEYTRGIFMRIPTLFT
jgi:cytochrome c oxidase assembly protein subunit 15